MKKQSTILLALKEPQEKSTDNHNRTLEDVLRDRLIALLRKDVLDARDMIMLIRAFVKERFPESKISNVFLYNTFVDNPNRLPERRRILEIARNYFRRKYNLKPRFPMDKIPLSRREEGMLAYDEAYNLHVWQDNKYHPVKYFTDEEELL